jgi:hypothetical protein
MREFFRGWRRKVGCVTLVMACVVMGLWIRGFHWQDSAEFCPSRTIYTTSSGYGYFAFQAFEFPARGAALSQSSVSTSPLRLLQMGWNSSLITEELGEFAPWKGAESEAHWKWQSFLVGTASFDTVNLNYSKSYAIIPCWSIAIPLTLLSAYLILWKPRKGA